MDSRSLDRDDGRILEALAALIRSRAGLTLQEKRGDDWRAALHRAAARSGMADARAYAHRLLARDLPLDDLVAQLVVGETYFFREPAQFDLIRKLALPEIRARRPAGHRLRLWSAGCASGEEAYSLAILIEEEGLSAQAEILGTDISAQALDRARAAVYGRWSLREDDGRLATRYFVPEAGGFRLLDRLRRRVAFAPGNLADPGTGSARTGFDLILCRNVLIYFSRDAIARAARLLFDTLAEGGWLLMGPSDPLLSPHAPFEVVLTPAGLAYRRPLPQASAPSSPVAPPLAAAPRPAPATAAAPAPKLRRKPARTAAARPSEDAARLAQEARRLADAGDLTQAARAAVGICRRFPLSAEGHFLLVLTSMGLRRPGMAVRAARRLLYLDRTLIVGHLLLGQALHQDGRPDEARRAYRNAHALAGERPPDEVQPLAEGETAFGLHRAAEHRLTALASGKGE